MSIHSSVIIFTVSTGIRYGNEDIFIAGSRSRFVYDINFVQSAQEQLLGGHARQSHILKRVGELGLRR